QLPSRCRPFRHVSGPLTPHGNSRGCAPVSDCAERGWHA
ncbi:hypothetical protein ATR1_114c0001, partial [Acetobacter tropicalis]